MKLLLTSFGIGANPVGGYFHRMPPIRFKMGNCGHRFVPDYPIFLLFEEFIIDEGTMDCLQSKHYRDNYEPMASLIDALNDAGRLKIVDFERIVEPHESVIRDAVEYDLRNIDSWIDSFDESLQEWNKFVEIARSIFSEKAASGSFTQEDRQFLLALEGGFSDGHFFYSTTGQKFEPLVKILRNWRTKVSAEEREYARKVVRSYLSHTCANLCLSDQLGAVLHDWADLGPIYNKKMSISVRDKSATNHCVKLRELFSVSFPAFEPAKASTVLRAINDKRIESLRDLVTKAVCGEVEFDQEFAHSVLLDALHIERRSARQRKLVGWLTTPLGLIPWAGTPLQKGAEAVASSVINHRLGEGKEWFYLISEMDDEAHDA